MPNDERKNPDLKGDDRDDAIEDGMDQAIKTKRDYDIRQQRQREKGFWDKLRDWFSPAPIEDRDLMA